jgi:DNA-binding HxlR family transcriptional regulator
MSEKVYECGLDAAVDVVGGKWKPLVLWALSVEPRRFGQLRRELPGVSEKVLIQQLRELERDGIVHRQVHEQVPPKVVYSLTELGKSLDRALAPLGEWGETNMAYILGLRSRSAAGAEGAVVERGASR